MSSFLHRLGLACFRHRWRALLGWVITLVVLGGIAGVVHGRFDDGFSIPGAQSQDALEQLQMNFSQVSGTTATLLVVAPDGADVNNAGVKKTVTAYLKTLDDKPYIESVTSPWDQHVKGLISDDKQAAIITTRLPGNAQEISNATRASIVDDAVALQKQLPAQYRVVPGGEAFSNDQPQMSITEVIGLGVALIVLFLTLGSLVAAGMPLLTAVLGVAATMCLLFISTGIAQINSTTPMLAVMLGLAVGIDYALFILSRHREQLGTGLDLEESAGRAVATAGSAVVFAGLTVIIALVGLGVAGIPFLTAMGVFAALGVAVAVIIALTLLPALMAFGGERLRPKAKRRTFSSTKIADTWVRLVTRLPLVTVAVVLVVAGALAYPAKDLQLALPNAGRAAPDTPQRISYDLTSEHFGPGYNGPLIVTAEIVASNDPLGVMAGLKQDIEKLPGVASVPVSTPNQNADTGFVQVVPTTGPDDPKTRDLVERLRAMAPGWQDRYDVPTAVTGATAIQIDVSDRLAGALLPFGLFVVGLSLLLLTMVFRSIAVPIKATLGYLLSIGVAFGITTLVFNQGHFKGLINLHDSGPVISFLPILLMGILFGLAMDYEVFLVSRMREDYVHGSGDNRAQQAIRSGFVGSSAVVTAAAAIMFFVFAFFVPEGEGPIKSIAFSLALGVAFDAFIVRMTFVPAVMALLGDRAWWLPRWLDRRLPTFDVEGETIYRQLALANWPEQASDWAVYGEELAVPGLYGPVDVAAHPGQVLLVEGDHATRAALLLTLTGRMRPETGRARVAGHLVEEEAAQVRGRTTYLDVAQHHDLRKPLAALGRPNGRPHDRHTVVVIDGVDALNSHQEHEMLLEFLATVPGSNRTVLLGVTEADALVPVLGESTDVLRLATPGQPGAELVDTLFAPPATTPAERSI